MEYADWTDFPLKMFELFGSSFFYSYLCKRKNKNKYKSLKTNNKKQTVQKTFGRTALQGDALP